MAVVVMLLGITCSLSQGQPSSDLYYVIIGAFANQKNAIAFAENVKKKSMDAQWLLIESRNLYYVYALETSEKEKAVSLALKLQSQSTLADAWVYSDLRGDHPTMVQSEKNTSDTESKLADDQTNLINNQTKTDPIITADGSKSFIFKIRSNESGEEVVGEVDIFDADLTKGRKIVSYKGNEIVSVKPVNKSGNLSVVCDVFGYRKIQVPLNFNKPKIENAVSLQNGNIVVTIDLVRLKKGDKVVMYNVYFFNDAAILRPESRSEVNSLLEYLKEKPTSKIRIHGHANGNDFGKIITLGESKNYYALSKDNHTSKGSATKLSEERARIIQSYLVKEGIDINRMELKAWGGKSPIYDEDHTLAHANVRVEVEIVEE
jgi:outer membrane protein OmpA-like peptidoglycan-associated protein